MEWKRFSEPSFVASSLACVLLAVVLATKPSVAQPSSTAPPAPMPSEAANLRPLLEELQLVVKNSNARLEDLQQKFEKLQGTANETTAGTTATHEDGFELHSKEDAEKLIAALGKAPTAEKFADAVAAVDEWVAAPEKADALHQFKAAQVAVLRQLVKKEVDLLHAQSLKADTGAKASELHAKASQVLALFPMESSKSVLEEARALSSRHAEAGSRIDVIRRQRYNAWAMTRVEETINDVNSLASSFSSADNPLIVDAAIKHLGEVDPLLLEPVVAQLYNYAVEQAKSNVTSAEQLDLGKRMIDPSIKRRSYGDF